MSFGAPQWLLLGVPLLLAWCALYRHAPRTRWLRLAFGILCVLALADLRLLRGDVGPAVMLLVDRSASVHGRALEQARNLATALQSAARDAQGQLWVLGFGRGANVLSAPRESFDALAHAPEQDDTDLAAGLRLGLGIAPADRPLEIVLISDGIYTGSDPRLELGALLARQARIHVLDVGGSRDGDSAITRVLAPDRVGRGQRFSVGVELQVARAQRGRLKLLDRAGRTLSERTLELRAGRQRQLLSLQAQRSGVQEFEAVLELGDDAEPGNNRARGVVEIVGPPRALLYNRGAVSSALAQALGSAGLELEVRGARTPLSAGDLHGVSALALENIELGELGPRAAETIAHYVSQLGGGLLITGGRSSYAMGGYFRSALEDLLPVSLERQQELRRARVDLAIALDRSGSMAAPARNGALKMDLANRGAAEAISLLAPGDGVTLMAVDSAVHVVSPLRRIENASDRNRLVALAESVEPGGGGIYVGVALLEAVEALLRGDAPARHIVLFADAADAEEPGDYAPLIARWRAARGTLSVIGLGTPLDPDAELLRKIAELGGGRAFFTDDALDLPRVFAQEVMYVARNTFVEGHTPAIGARGLLALGQPGTKLPAVEGYNLTFLRDGADPIVLSDDENSAPLAASWQRGAGKVAAVTFEADGPFSGELARWPGYKPFFRALLEWIKRAPGPDDIDASIRTDGRIATITVELPRDRPRDPPTHAWVHAPNDGEHRPLRLHTQAPGVLSASFPLQSGGMYQSAIALPGGPPLALAPVTLAYSPELAITSGDSERGSEVLNQLSRATGGAAFTHPRDVLRGRGPQARSARPASDWIALAMLVLVLIEVAHRRGLLDGPLTRLRAQAQAWLPHGPALSMLRALRTQRGPGPHGSASPPRHPSQPPAHTRAPAAGGAAAAPEPEDGTAAEPVEHADEPLRVAKRRARRP